MLNGMYYIKLSVMFYHAKVSNIKITIIKGKQAEPNRYTKFAYRYNTLKFHNIGHNSPVANINLNKKLISSYKFMLHIHQMKRERGLIVFIFLCMTKY